MQRSDRKKLTDFTTHKKIFVLLRNKLKKMDTLQKYSYDIAKLCENHKVKSLYVFGSVLTDRFNDESDIDLIVDFSNIAVEDYADNYFDFKFSLQDILKRPIDLLEEKAIKNPYFKQSVIQQRQLIYGQ